MIPETIEKIPDDILLCIFRHYLGATPRFWPTLASVCRIWRQIVFSTPLGLNLRLYCTYGTHFLKTLDLWPSLPIVVQYGGFLDLDPPTPEDDENIITALKQSGRVGSISLTITSSLFERLSAILDSFLELEELTLLSLDNMQPPFPNSFGWGPRLRTLQSTRISLPLLPQLLLPSRDLVDIQLLEIPSAGYFSPDAFASAISEMTQLETLSLHFLSLPPRRSYLRLPPQSGERIILPSLTHLKYRETSKYLDSLVGWIDAPRLGDIDVTIFFQPTMDALQLGRFIERIEMQASLSQAEIQTSARAISLCISHPGAPPRVKLQISCERLDWQLSSMTQICNRFSPFLFRVNEVGISSAQSSSRRGDMDGDSWSELIAALGGANDFRVSGVHVTDILCALHPAHGAQTTNTAVLPSLSNLRVEQPMTTYGSLWDAVQSFITSRWLSARPVVLYAQGYRCHICHKSFTEQQRLKRHLGDRHAYRIVCSHCGDFEWQPDHNTVLREHLEHKHPEIARNDPLIRNHHLSFQVDSLVYWHCSLRAPDVVPQPRLRVPTDRDFRLDPSVA